MAKNCELCKIDFAAIYDEMERDADNEIEDVVFVYDIRNQLPFEMDTDDAMEHLQELPCYDKLCEDILNDTEDVDYAIINLLHLIPIINDAGTGYDYDVDLFLDFETYEYIITNIQDGILDLGIPYSRLSIYEFVNNKVREMKKQLSDLTLCYFPPLTMIEDFIDYCIEEIYSKFLSYCKQLRDYCKDDDKLYEKLMAHYEWLTPEYFGYNTQINFEPNAIKERYKLLCELGFYGYHGFRKIVRYNYSWCGLNKNNSYKFLPYHLQIEKYRKSRKPDNEKCDFCKFMDSTKYNGGNDGQN